MTIRQNNVFNIFYNYIVSIIQSIIDFNSNTIYWMALLLKMTKLSFTSMGGSRKSAPGGS